MKKERASDHHHHILHPWLAPPPMSGPGPCPPLPPSTVFSQHLHGLGASNSKPGGGLFSLVSAAGGAGAGAAFHQPLLPQMSATALLQKAAQMGATMTAPFLPDQRTTMAVCGNIQTPSLFQDYMMNSAVGFDQGEAFDDTLGGFLRTSEAAGGEENGDGGGGGGEGMTRDFLGLTSLPHSDFLSFAGLGNCINTTTSEQQQQQSHSQKPSRRG